MAISGKVFDLRVKVFLIRGLSHLGPWARIWKAFLFKGFGAQKGFLLRFLEPQESFFVKGFWPGPDPGSGAQNP